MTPAMQMTRTSEYSLTTKGDVFPFADVKRMLEEVQVELQNLDGFGASVHVRQHRSGDNLTTTLKVLVRS